jgi:hypothetical protein
MLRAFFGRHKSASTWARNIIHDAAAALDMKILTIHVSAQYESYGTLGDMIRVERPDILIMTRPFQHEVDTIEDELRAVHLIRDPRDIIVSGYFSHRNSHPEVFGGIAWPELIEHRKTLKSVDKEAGIEAEIEFSNLFLEPMSTWNYHQPGVLEIKMEDLIADQAKQWTVLFSHYEMLYPEGTGGERVKLAKVRWNLAARRGTPRTLALMRKALPRVPLDRLPHSYVDNVLDRYSFTNLSKSDRKPGQVDENNHYRKGMARDWENHLTPRHLELINRRYGDLVQRLGYH